MAISAVNFAPHIWNQAYNPIMWSISSNQTTQPNFKYVFDLYVNGATGYTYRLKQNPNPQGYGVIDVSSFLQPFTDVDLYAPETAIYPLFYGNSRNTVATVEVKAGEEYSVNGALTIFNGSGATGSPAYTLPTVEGQTLGATNDTTVRVLPAALPYQKAVDIMGEDQSWIPFWTNYIPTYGPGGLGKFLKRQEGEISVYDYDCHALAFLNWIDLNASYDQGIQLIQIKQYNSAGTLLSTQNIQNTVSAGGGPQTTSAYTSLTFSRNALLLYFQCGPKNLQVKGIWNNNTAYYTVQGFNKLTATSSTTPGYATTELVTFRITDACTDLYPRVRVSWLNDLGGRDYYNFTMFYEKTTNSPGEVYQQANYNYSGQYPVPVQSNLQSSTVNDSWLRGGNKSFNKVVTESFSIQTDFLTQDEIDYLPAIGQSPQVWVYIGDEDLQIPKLVTITNVSYTYKNVKQVKLVQATYDMVYTKITKKQNI
jgi:hypothetical protein